MNTAIASDLVERRKQCKRALFIKKTLGTRFAAGYLRNRGWPVEAAVALLCTGRFV